MGGIALFTRLPTRLTVPNPNSAAQALTRDVYYHYTSLVYIVTWICCRSLFFNVYTLP